MMSMSLPPTRDGHVSVVIHFGHWIYGFANLDEGEEQTRTGLKSHFTPRDNAAASTRCVHSPTLTHGRQRGQREGGKKCVARRRESAATPHGYLATRTKLIIIAPFSSASRASERAGAAWRRLPEGSRTSRRLRIAKQTNSQVCIDFKCPHA